MGRTQPLPLDYLAFCKILYRWSSICHKRVTNFTKLLQFFIFQVRYSQNGWRRPSLLKPGHPGHDAHQAPAAQADSAANACIGQVLPLRKSRRLIRNSTSSTKPHCLPITSFSASSRCLSRSSCSFRCRVAQVLLLGQNKLLSEAWWSLCTAPSVRS
jgi:hypothetical protein